MNSDFIKEACPVIQDFPKPGVGFVDVFPLLNNKKCFRSIVHFISTETKNNIAILESRAFCFAPAIQLDPTRNFNIIPVRKAGKLPNVKYQIHSTKEYGEDILEMQDFGSIDEITIFDDILATGGTAKALAQFFKSQNPNITIKFLFIIELATELHGRNVLTEFGEVKSLCVL